MKFLADMGISPKTVAFLQNRGHEAAHLSELGLFRLEDAEILDKARLDRCILLTHDLDFGGLLAAMGSDLPSVIIFRLRDMRPERVNRYLERILDQHAKALETGSIITVTEGQIRMRKLPLVISP